MKSRLLISAIGISPHSPTILERRLVPFRLDPWPKCTGKETGRFSLAGPKVVGVRVREMQREPMILNLGEIHPKESKLVPKRLPIDYAQTKKLVDAGNRCGVFDLRQPSTRYAIILVLFCV